MLRELTAPQLVRRAIHSAYENAEAGRANFAKRYWLLAIRFSIRCGGISGPSLGGDWIVLTDGLVSYRPVALR